MLKSAKGEMSAGLIIGLVLVVVIIIGLIFWSRSNKSDTMTTETDGVMMNDVETTETTGSTSPTTTDAETTMTTTTTTTTTTNPTLPQTGMGPDEQ